MKDKRKHFKFLALLLSIVMVMSTAMVFAEVEEEPASNEPVATVQSSDDGVDQSQNNQAETQSDDKDGGAVAPSSVNPSISLKPGSTSIDVNGNTKIEATLENAPEGDIAVEWDWSIDPESVATIEFTANNANVTGKAAGTATVKATAKIEGYEPIEASCTIEVADTAGIKVAPSLGKPAKKYSSKDYEGSKDNGYTLSWSHDGQGVDHYEVFRNGTSTGVKIAKNASGKYSYFVLVPAGNTNKYKIRAVGSKSGDYKDSAEYNVAISGVITATHAYTWYCKTKKKVKTGGVTIPKGTTLTAVGRSPKKIKKFRNPNKVQVIYKGRKVWVPYKKLKGGVKASVNVKQDYSRSLKEYMVNHPATFSKNTKEASAIRGKTVTSGDNHLLWACLYTQRVYTFERANKNSEWKLVHTDRITTGKFSHPTRSSETSGFYTINKKKQGKVWVVQENGKRYYFTHASYITKGISFHTGTWWASGKTRGKAKANGQPGTYGCIRMYTDGAKYVFSKTAVNKTRAIVTRFD